MSWTKLEAGKFIKPRDEIWHASATENFAPSDCTSSSISEHSSSVCLVSPENDTGNADFYEQDVIDGVKDLVIKTDSMTEFQLESSEVMEDARTFESDEPTPFA